MIFTNGSEYAIRALSAMALKSREGPVLLDELVNSANPPLPRDYLAKVFQKLVHGGVLRSVKGRGGGFTLARPPHQISVMDIVGAVDGPQRFDGCVVGLEQCTDHAPCPQHDLYKPIRQRLKDYLMTTTLADLASSLKSKQARQAGRAASASRK